MEFMEQLPTKWQTYWQELGYQSPSPIQTKSYNLLLEKHNLIGISPTGSGKTVAYLLPLLQQIQKGQGAQLLILLPSQELAVQVAAVAKSWASLIELQVQSLIGGANVKRQIEKLKEKPEVLVGTPGRVFELIKGKKLKAHLLKMVVLDEVDQLIETSELNATKNILKTVTNEIQLVCVSATAFNVTEQLGTNWSQDLNVLDVSAEDQSAGAVSHGFIRVAPRKRVDLLRKLAYVKDFKAIVFFNELPEMGSVADKLTFLGVPNATLASDQNKLERRLAISAFEDDKVSLLLTTDIAARGLDFKHLPYVIHYDVPYNQEGYVHRSGRTGRMGQDGTVLSLTGDYELKDLKKIMRQQEHELIEFLVHSGQIAVVTEANRGLVEVAEEKEAQKKRDTKKVTTAKELARGNQITKPIKEEVKLNQKEQQRRTKKAKQKNQKNKGARKKNKLS